MQLHALGNSTGDNLHAQACYFTSKAAAKWEKSVSVLQNKGVSPHLRVWYNILFPKGQSTYRTNWHVIQSSLAGSPIKIWAEAQTWQHRRTNDYLSGSLMHSPYTQNTGIPLKKDTSHLSALPHPPLTAWTRAAHAGEPCIFPEWCNCAFLRQVRRHYIQIIYQAIYIDHVMWL